MEIGNVIRDARAGKWKPVYVLVGTETLLIDRAVNALRSAALGAGADGLNVDIFHGKGLSAQSLVRAANTMPMFANARFILVRDVESIAAAEQDTLAAYLSAPSPSTCLVFIGEKVDGRMRFAKAAKQSDCFAEVQALKGPQVRSFAIAEAKGRGHVLEADAADALADSIGADLSALDDALERLSLYVEPGKAISLLAVEACITRVRVETIWALVDAVSMRDGKTALRAAASLLADREPALRILAMVARQLRMVARMRDALAQGLRGPDAAKHAGAPPFKAYDLGEAAKRFTPGDLQRAFRTLASTDMALKGSRRPPETVLEEALVQLCSANA
jgi:DNA polymerase-3 subunit delta